ncbi:MAG: DUF1552 domain-containing protein [Planctomycetaceae bacterium]|nr:DUF1552 domain-containing protein [Planctomycetaceae bacterium]
MRNDQIRVSRRQMLQGTGIALTLPALVSAERRACGGGTIGPRLADSTPRRLVCVGNHLGFYPGHFFPTTAGKDYQTTSTLRPLDPHRRNLTVFSHLDHGLNGGHRGVQGFLNSIKKEEAAGFPEKNVSLDQVAAEHAGTATRFPVINMGVHSGTDMCWTRAGNHVPPVNDPAAVFRALFVQSSAAERQTERIRLEHRGSVLDALRESAAALEQTLNAADRNKLDQYLTSVRDVERRLQMSAEWLDRPKPKSPMKPIASQERQHIDELALFYDLMALALQTDSTRVATLETGLGFRTSELDLGSYHQLSHHGKSDDRIGQLQIVEAFLTEKLSRFISRLKDAEIFDDTLIVFGSGMSDASVHSNRNLPVLLAGGGLDHQGHLVCPAASHQRVPLANLWLSVLQWFGCQRDRFGRSTGTFSPMNIG